MAESGLWEYVELLERYYEEKVTDGLPVVPPLKELVERAVATTGREPDEVVGTIPPQWRPATVRDIAVNAVMAGCKAEYLPVVLAAVEAMLEERFNWFHLAVSTKGCAPLVVVNGPIRHRLGINSGGNVFGPGFRANATIGRALRLVMMNLGGAEPQVLDRSTQGHPGKFTFCIAEDEEHSPWEPYHVSRGFRAEESTVFVHHSEAPRLVNQQTTHKAEALLACLADMICPLGSYPLAGPTEVVLVIGREHAATIAGGGYSRRDVQEYMWEHAARRAGDLRRVDTQFPGISESMADDEPVRILRAPEDVHVVVAGGPGRMSSVCFGFTAVENLTASAMRQVTVATGPET